MEDKLPRPLPCPHCGNARARRPELKGDLCEYECPTCGADSVTGTQEHLFDTGCRRSCTPLPKRRRQGVMVSSEPATDFAQRPTTIVRIVSDKQRRWLRMVAERNASVGGSMTESLLEMTRRHCAKARIVLPDRKMIQAIVGPGRLEDPSGERAAQLLLACIGRPSGQAPPTGSNFLARNE
jgi:hypothetical protein